MERSALSDRCLSSVHIITIVNLAANTCRELVSLMECCGSGVKGLLESETDISSETGDR